MKKTIRDNKFFILIYFISILIIISLKLLIVFLFSRIIEEIVNKNLKDFLIDGAIIISFLVVNITLNFLISRVKIKNIEKNIYLYKKNISKKISKMNYVNFYYKETGSYFSWFKNDMDFIRNYLNIFYLYINYFSSVILTLVFIFYLSWIIGIIALFLMVCVLIIILFFNSFFKNLHKKISINNEIYSKSIVNIISKYKYFFFLQKNQIFNSILNEHSKTFFINDFNIYKKIIIVSYILSMIFIFSQTLLTTLIIILAGTSFIEFSISFSLATYSISLFIDLGYIVNNFSSFLGNSEILNKHKYKNEVNIKEEKFQKIPFENISLNNVFFRYNDKEIFKNFSMNFIANKKYALIGPSGSGKSTLLKLILCLEKSQEGQILLNEKKYNFNDIIFYSNFLSNHTDIFSGTVLDNITFWDESKNEEAKSICNSLKLVDKKIENESILSQGERQRIAIARHLISKKPVLFLDESISNIDKESRKLILKTILSNSKLTLIFISHHIDETEKKLFNKIIDLSEVN